ncbi:MAG: hypothetical protein K0R99_4542 [Microbacterium sp.]|nr:hypothetical protein [Microbacterium sp.]
MTSTPGIADTTEAVSAVAAMGVVSVFLLAKPPRMMPASASTSRMPVEIRKALLRSFDPISRSATSQMPLVLRTGAGVLTG